MRLAFSYTVADVQEWARSQTRSAVRDAQRRWRWVILGATVLLVGLVVYQAVRATNAAPPAPPADPALAPQDLWGQMVLPSLPYLIPPVLIFWFLRNQGRFAWRQNRTLREPHLATLDDGGLELAGPGTATRFGWSAFRDWTETANLFLLRQQGGAFTALPKRAATPAEQEQLRALFRTRIGTPAGGGPVGPPGPAGGNAAPPLPPSPGEAI